MNEPAFTTESTVSNEFGHHTLRWSDIEGVVHALLKSSPASPKTPEATDLILGPLKDFFTAPGKGLRAELVHVGWRYAGFDGAAPIELVVGIELLHAGSLIIDDVQDESLSRRGRPCLHRTLGVGPALNLGNILYFLAVEAIARVDERLDAQGRLNRYVNQTLIRCHQGQAMDLCLKVDALAQNRVAELVLETTRLKTGALTALALSFGAHLANLPVDERTLIDELGHDLGICLQMYDDLSGIVNPARAGKGLEDLSAARPTWPWAWLSQQVDAATFNSLTARLHEDGDRQFGMLKNEIINHLGDAAHIIHTRLDRALSRFVALRPQTSAGIEEFVRRLKTGYL